MPIDHEKQTLSKLIQTKKFVYFHNEIKNDPINDFK